ncbi:MAG: hypothetical protein Q7K55_09335 [Candidatus Levybacteria bacterium]|nr:hypothetical protein [Candidatus Levybacteria bacterium]
MREYEPKGDIAWKKEDSLFGTVLIASQIDFVSGIKTSWVKDPRDLRTTRTDEFPDSNFHRSIEISESNTTFNICGLANNTPIDFEISSDSESGKKGCNLAINTSGQTEITSTNINYDQEGQLQQLSIIINPESIQDQELKDYYQKRSSEENMLELVDIYKAVGQSLFVTGTTSDDAFAQEQALGLNVATRKDAFDRITLNWPGKYKDLMVKIVQYMAEITIGFAAEDKLSDDDKELMSALLAMRALDIVILESDHLPINLEDENNEDFFIDLFDKCVVDALYRHNSRLENTPSLYANFEQSKENKDKFNFSVVEQDTDVVDSISGLVKKVEITIGEEHRYEDYSYIIESTENGNLNIKIKKLRGQSTYTIVFVLPEKLDISKLYDIISNPANQGWEKAFKEIDAKCIQ